MQTFLVVLLVLAMVAAVVALVRGVVAFLKTSHADLHGPGLNASGMKQNKMMQARVMFQALAVIVVVLLLLLRGS